MMHRENTQKSKTWKKSDEHLLEEWADHSKGYRWMHEQARIKFWKKNAQFQIPVIIISTITGAANFAQDRVPTDFQSHYSLIVGFLNIVAGVIATIQTFLKVAELLEAHRVASMSWGKYYHNVKTELQKEPEDRESVNDFMKYAKAEYEKLVEQSPPIPPMIITAFKERVEKQGVQVYLPPIMGVFDKFQIGESLPRFEPKDKSDVEKVLGEIDEEARTRFDKPSRSPSVSNSNSPGDDNNGGGLLSNKLLSAIFTFPNSIPEPNLHQNIEQRVGNIVESIPIDLDENRP